jgi:type VI secretion system VasD/TssJ family lipoprotein
MMNKASRSMARLITLGLCLVLAGCGMFQSKSREEALRELTWNYEQQGIQLNITADPMLNETGGQAHNLLLVVAQMEDPNAFSAFARDPELLTNLLLSDRAPEGILDIQRIYIEPGAQRELSIHRVQSAKYVGIAAGYAQLDPARSARLYQIGVAVNSDGWFFREHTAAPEPLAIQLRLGPVGIQDSLSKRADPPAPVQPKSGLVEIGATYPAPIVVPVAAP